MKSRNGSQSARGGVTYRGRAAAEDVARAVEAASAGIGLECRREPSGDGLRISCRQREPWHRMLRRALPDRAEWMIHPSGEEIVVRRRYWMAPWYAALIVVHALTIFTVVWTAPLAIEVLGLSSLTVLYFVALVLLTLSSLRTVYLVRALEGGASGDDLHRSIIEEVERRGGTLDPVGTGADRRSGAALIAFVVPLIAFVVWSSPGTLGLFLDRSLPAGNLVMLAALVFSAACLVGAAILMLTARGAAVRLSPAIGGLSMAVAFVLLLGIHLLFSLSAGSLGQIDSSSIGTRREMATAVPEVLTIIEGLRQTSAAHLRMLLAFSGGVAAMAVGFFLMAPRMAARAAPDIDRMGPRRKPGDLHHTAVSDARTFRRFQPIFTLFWTGFGFAVVTGWNGAISAALHGSGLLPPGATPDGPALSAALLPLAFGLPAGDPWIGALVRGAWGLYGLAVTLPPVLALGQLARARARLRRNLRAASAHPQARRLETMARKLASGHLGEETIRVAVDVGHHAPRGEWTTPSLRLESHRFGLLRPERWIEISGLDLERVDRSAQQALVAHELGHHLAGHCERDRLYRWIGRLTLTGDAFVRVLQHSFGYELEADRRAKDDLGVSSRALLRVLGIVLNVQSLELRRRMGSGLPAAPGEAADQERGEGEPDRAPPPALRESWRLLLAQFTSTGRAARDSYWHPVLEERRRALIEPSRKATA